MEFLIVIATLACLGLIALALLKLCFWLLLLPLKIAACALTGFFGLIFLIPLAVLWAFAASFALPVFVGLLALPAICVVLGIIALVRFIV